MQYHFAVVVAPAAVVPAAAVAVVAPAAVVPAVAVVVVAPAVAVALVDAVAVLIAVIGGAYHHVHLPNYTLYLDHKII